MFIGFNPILYFSHIYGLLLSSGRSIFLFNIPLIIALFSLVQFKQKHQKEFWLIFSLSILYLLFIACFYNWGSLFSWGPRYLLPIVPLLTIPAYLFFQRVVNWQKCKKLIIVMLFIFCFLMQFSAVFLNHLNWVAIFYTNKQIAAIYSPTISVQFIPSTSPTIGQMRLFFGYFKNVLTNRDDFYEIYASQYKTDHSVFPPRLLKTDNFKVNLSHYTSTNIIWFKADYLAKIISRIAIFVWYILLLSSTFFVIKCIKLTDNL
jgi:hypothetical protein